MEFKKKKKFISFKEEVEDDYENRADVVLMVVRERDHGSENIKKKMIKLP